MPTAKIEIDFPMSKRLGSFLDDIKGFASDPAHEADRDVIADFVDKVLVVEMKRYMAKDEFRKVSVDIPQDVLMEPLKNARKLVEGLFRNLTGEQLASDPAPEEIEKAVTPRKDTLADIEADINGVPAPAASPVAPIVNQKRSGNGHVAAKKRDLDSTEKDRVRQEFLNLNGQIAQDACLPMLKQCGSEATIFQVTGFVTYLHRLVAMGKLLVTDQQAYETYLQGHRKLWETYNSLKYRTMRKAP